MGKPRIRNSVRVVMLDDRDRVRLMRAEHSDTGEGFWFPPGGRIEADEDLEAAARREVAEETGHLHVKLGPEIWRRQHVFTWRGRTWDQRERWFLARVQASAPSERRLTADESEDVTETRWWTLDELDAAEERLVPADLAGQLRRVLHDGPPTEPIEIGE